MIPEDAVTVGLIRELIAVLPDAANLMIAVDGGTAVWATVAMLDLEAGNLDIYGGQVNPSLREHADDQLDIIRAHPRRRKAVRPLEIVDGPRGRHVDIAGRAQRGRRIMLLAGPQAGRMGTMTHPLLDEQGRVEVVWNLHDGIHTDRERIDPADVEWATP